MVKLIHTGDIRIGKSFNFLSESLREENRTCIKQALFRLMKCAKEREVDAVIINGDLFNSNYPLEEDVKFAADTFSSISGIKVFIVPGEHDYLGLERIKDMDILPKNVYIFDKNISAFKIKEKVKIHGIGYSYTNNKKNIRDIAKIQKVSDEINILCFYGQENGKKEGNGFFYKSEALSEMGYDYIAIGKEPYFKSVVSIGNTIMAAHSGSLVVTGFEGEGEAKGFIYLEADKNRSNFEFVEGEVNNFKRIVIDVTNCNCEEITHRISQLIHSNIYEVVLKGEMDIWEYVDIGSVMEKLNSIRVISIIDRITLNYFDESANFSGRAKEVFIKNIMDTMKINKEMESLYKKVLRHGLSAMESRVLA